MKLQYFNSTRHIALLVVAILSVSLELKAQSDSLANLPQYMNPEFTKSIVKMKSGDSHTALMNYNTVTGKMIFYQGGLLMELNKPENVDTIFLQNAKFVYHEKAFYEVLVDAPIALFIQHKSNLSSSEKPSAYGASSQSSASTSVSKLYDDKAYNLKLPENFKVIQSPVYWVRMNNDMYKFASERQFLNIFPTEAARIKKFIKENNIDIKIQDDLIKLVNYCNELR